MFWIHHLQQLQPDMASPELVFLHIPKAAGTSQRGAFQQHYGAENVFWYGRDTAPNIESYPRKQIGEKFVVGGHKMLSFYPRRLDALYCAILRDPIERAISLFAYYSRPQLAKSPGAERARERARRKKIEQGLDPESMLRSIHNSDSFREEISNCQCAYLSVRDRTFVDVRKSLKKRDHVIGSMRHHARFHSVLSDILGWSDSAAAVINRSRDDYAAPFLEDEELVALIRELNVEDQELIDWVDKEQGGVWQQLLNDTRRRRRLGRQPLLPAKNVKPALQWGDAADLWPVRDASALKWPLDQMLVLPAAKLVYVPVPGSADRAIKKMIVQLSAVQHKDAMLELGIDRVSSRYVTGLVLADHDQQQIQEIAESDDYFRFSVIYEPLARLLDLFEQRFVRQRTLLSKWRPLCQLVADAQQCQEADCDTGISFRQFVLGLVSGRYRHRLLLTQTRHLPWPDSCDRIYLPQQLSRLAADLAEVSGLRVQLPELAPATPVVIPTGEAIYADTPASELPVDSGEWRGKVLDSALLGEIKRFYALDLKLYNRTAQYNQYVVTE